LGRDYPTSNYFINNHKREYTVENIIEVSRDVFVDKEVKVKRVVEVPVVNPIIRRVPREKVVEVLQEVVKPVVVEVEEYTKDSIRVPLNHSKGRV